MFHIIDVIAKGMFTFTAKQIFCFRDSGLNYSVVISEILILKLLIDICVAVGATGTVPPLPESC